MWGYLSNYLLIKQFFELLLYKNKDEEYDVNPESFVSNFSGFIPIRAIFFFSA